MFTQVREVSHPQCPSEKISIEQIFVLVRMQFHNHADTTSETLRKGYAMYIRYQIWNVASEQE